MKQTVVKVPGIYSGHEVDYSEIDAVNQSTLKAIAKSPLHYQHGLTHPKKQTNPMRLGLVAHTAVLEPHRLDTDFALWAPVDEDTGEILKDDFKGNVYKAFAARAELEGRTVIKQRDLDTAKRIGEAVRGNALAMRYLKKVRAELILVWRDEETGIVCKARLDGVSESVPDVLVELKSAVDVAPWAFESAFAKRMYHLQTAFYSDGWKACTGRELHGGKCIAVENLEPHDVIVYDLAEVTDIGRETKRELLGKVAECRRSGLWLGQSPLEERTLRLPKWLEPDDENTLDELGLEYANG
jgi:exodeoxyribonuclease VIII